MFDCIISSMADLSIYNPIKIFQSLRQHLLELFQPVYQSIPVYMQCLGSFYQIALIP